MVTYVGTWALNLLQSEVTNIMTPPSVYQSDALTAEAVHIMNEKKSQAFLSVPMMLLDHLNH